MNWIFVNNLKGHSHRFGNCHDQNIFFFVFTFAKKDQKTAFCSSQQCHFEIIFFLAKSCPLKFHIKK